MTDTVYKPRSKGGPDLRGNSKDRKRRKEWLLTEFGDGTTAPCAHPDCTEMLTYDTVTADRYPVPGALGGRYVRGNIRPMCSFHNCQDGGLLSAELKTYTDEHGVTMSF